MVWSVFNYLLTQKLARKAKVALGCSQYKKLLKTLKIAQKLPSTTYFCLVARKCESKHWFSCGVDGRSVGRSVYGHVLNKVSGIGIKNRTDLKCQNKESFVFNNRNERTWNFIFKYIWKLINIILDLVTVFDAILTSRQTCEKLQCLYEYLMSNNFRRTTVLKKNMNCKLKLHS